MYRNGRGLLNRLCVPPLAIRVFFYLEYAVEGHPGLAGVVKDVHALIVAAPELLVDGVVELTLELTETVHIGACAVEAVFPAPVVVNGRIKSQIRIMNHFLAILIMFDTIFHY